MLARETSADASRAISAPKHAAAPATGRPRPSTFRGGDQTEAGREVIEALGIAPAVAPAACAPSTSADQPAPAPRTPTAPAAARTTDVEFAPRVVGRRVLSALVLLLVPATLGAAYLAYDDPTTLSLGVTGLLLVVLLVLYAVRAGSTTARLAIHSGQLEVVRGASREVFDLTSRFTRFEVIGKPGRPGWKVLMARFGRDPLVIDSSMVDPVAFTAALDQHRVRR